MQKTDILIIGAGLTGLTLAYLLKKQGVIDNPVLLVTSAIHMPRSVAVFRGVGMNVIPSPTDISILDLRNDGLFNWLPSVGALGSTSRAVHEYIGLVVYWMRGWLAFHPATRDR